MVRKYKRKTEAKTYTVDSIVRALNAIRLGAHIRAAARDFGIPERTLRDHWNKNQSLLQAAQDEKTTTLASASAATGTASRTPTATVTPTTEAVASNEPVPSTSAATPTRTEAVEPTEQAELLSAAETATATPEFLIRTAGHPTIFNPAEEQALENYMLHSSDIYFGLTATAGRELAFQYANRLKKTIPKTWSDKRLAGIEWLRLFMKRHPKLSMRRAEATSLARVSAFNRANVTAFFDLYVKASQNIDFRPQNIWNVDETGLTTVHKADRVISRRGAKRVGQVTSAERGNLVSMALAVNAFGQKAPPYLIFPRVRFQEHFLTGGPTGCSGGANPSGFMNGDILLDFMKRFCKFTRCTVANPILLLLDNHVSHRTLDVITFCRENGIHMLSFPPHCSHRLQPLDVSIFGPWRKAANKLCKDWVDTHPGKVMQIYDLPPIFKDSLSVGATESNIQAGFSGPGIWPLNRFKFQDIDFMPSATTDRPFTAANIIAEADIPMAVDIELPDNISQQNIEFDDDEDDSAELRPLGRTSTPTNSTQGLDSLLRDIRPTQQAPPRSENSRSRKIGKTTILTSDESIQEIRAEKEARDAKQTANQNRKAATAAKKKAAVLKKLTAEAKKAATKRSIDTTPSAPGRVSKRRKTTVKYVDESNSEED